ncbi:MAG TPA: dihydrofolate reductase [Parcubacteria group bacterium]|nr:dihydrofolate reductase [Parcubacteria group bacterium]
MLNIIVAISQNGVIGKNGGLPWHLPDDLRWFKGMTAGYPVVMGTKTFDSIIKAIGKPLPGRESVVLTRRPRARRCDGVIFTDNFDMVVEMSKTRGVFVIGGADLFRLALPFASKIYLTQVHTEIEGDTVFPEWNKGEWILEYSDDHPVDEKHEFPFTWEIYSRRAT